MKYDRAYRHVQIVRLKKNRTGYWGRLYKRQDDAPLTERQLGKLAHTACVCSCYMCGNPRKHFFRATLKEEQFLAESFDIE